MAVYAQMREDNLRAAEKYGPGRFWGEINDTFADFVWAGALENLRTEYFNRRFAGPEPGSRQVWRALLWVYYQKLQEIDRDGFLESASDSREGGDGDQDLIGGRPMSLDFLQSVEEVYRSAGSLGAGGPNGSAAIDRRARRRLWPAGACLPEDAPRLYVRHSGSARSVALLVALAESRALKRLRAL